MKKVLFDWEKIWLDYHEWIDEANSVRDTIKHPECQEALKRIIQENMYFRKSEDGK